MTSESSFLFISATETSIDIRNLYSSMIYPYMLKRADEKFIRSFFGTIHLFN